MLIKTKEAMKRFQVSRQYLYDHSRTLTIVQKKRGGTLHNHFLVEELKELVSTKRKRKGKS